MVLQIYLWPVFVVIMQFESTAVVHRVIAMIPQMLDQLVAVLKSIHAL